VRVFCASALLVASRSAASRARSSAARARVSFSAAATRNSSARAPLVSAVPRAVSAAASAALSDRTCHAAPPTSAARITAASAATPL